MSWKLHRIHQVLNSVGLNWTLIIQYPNSCSVFVRDNGIRGPRGRIAQSPVGLARGPDIGNAVSTPARHCSSHLNISTTPLTETRSRWTTPATLTLALVSNLVNNEAIVLVSSYFQGKPE